MTNLNNAYELTIKNAISDTCCCCCCFCDEQKNNS